MSVEADGDGYVLTVRADSDWIGESGRAFPVVIDPSWSIPKSNFKDVYVINGICANEPRAIKEIRAGRNLTNTVRSYVKIEMPENLPAGSVITGGELTFRKISTFLYMTARTLPIGARRLFAGMLSRLIIQEMVISIIMRNLSIPFLQHQT